MSAVSVIGTGLMGTAIARQLHIGGLDVGVWNRSPASAEALLGNVTRIHGTVDDALVHGDLIILCLADYEVAETLFEATSTALQGLDVVNLITGSPADAERFEGLVTAAGGRYLDGAIEAYPADIGEAGTLINLSGSPELWLRHRGALTALAGAATYLGSRVGAANAADVAFAGAFYNVAIGGFLEAASYAVSAGISVDDIDGSVDYWLALLSNELRLCVKALRTGEHGTDQATLAVYLAAVRSWRDTMIHAGQRASLMTANLHNLEIADAAGLGELGISAQITTATITPAASVRVTYQRGHP